ncbi:MAG: hypothetical protein KGL39_19195 [Patescibacteria group bacterium]|nr:hypothetical protein [Patescibacteria group bacterium]
MANLNPNSFRLPSNLEGKAEPEVVNALRAHTDGITDLNQAITALKQQVDSVKSSSGTNTVTYISSGSSGNPFPFLGSVNDQRGVTSYTIQPTDSGAKIVFANASPITLILNAAVSTPWFSFIDNDSSASVNLSPTSGLVIGEAKIPANGFGIIFFNGVNWFCGATQQAPVIGIDSSITTAKLTSGGTQGLMTFSKGVLVSSVQAT